MDKLLDGIPSQSEVIGCYGKDEKTNEHAEQTKSKRKYFWGVMLNL